MEKELSIWICLSVIKWCIRDWCQRAMNLPVILLIIFYWY